MLRYKDCPVLASEAATRHGPGVKVTIGPPQIVAARDDAPDEGTFVGPRLRRFGDDVYLHWKFDRDVLDQILPDRPNGRVSRDGGLSWERQTTLQPTGASFRQVSRLRGPSLHPQASGPDGTLYSLVYSRYLRDVSKSAEGDREFWQHLNWHRYAVLLQTSTDDRPGRAYAPLCA